MCGIIGMLSQHDVTDRLMGGLKRLEYRGYDSAGVCTMYEGELQRRRSAGKLCNLERTIAAEPLRGNIGIAHTRWATHGAPTRANAHPHVVGDVALVHNGIIENFQSLRDELALEGRSFESDTDSEVVAHLIQREMEHGVPPREAVATTLGRLHGAFSFAILCRNHESLLIGARRGSPLVIGYGDGETYLGSDALALALFTRKVSYLEEGDWVVISAAGAEVYDHRNQQVSRPVVNSRVDAIAAQKGSYQHFMQKEIFEQPDVLARTIERYVDPTEQTASLPSKFSFNQATRLTIVACGTSYYAGMIAKYWFEQYARIPVSLDLASEFRYREPVLEPGGVALFISQSGETADTLAALRHARTEQQTIAAVVNVPTSSMAREADVLLPTYAGPEIGVASTKAFTCQLAVLAAFAIKAAVDRALVSKALERRFVAQLLQMPAAANAALMRDWQLQQLAHRIAQAQDVFYLGRGLDHVIALEGALKLKEISYIHAEGYAAGELKHGPLAMIDEQVPVVVVAPSGPLLEKTMSNMQEVHARGGKIMLLSDTAGIHKAASAASATVAMPKVNPLTAPIVYAVAVQLLAYHAARLRGADVDQPRNLAKSVTVE